MECIVSFVVLATVAYVAYEYGKSVGLQEARQYAR